MEKEEILRQIGNNFRRYYLGHFAVPAIDRGLFDYLRDVRVMTNLVIQCEANFDTIRQIVATLLIKDQVVYKYKDVGLKEIADRFYNTQVDDDANSYSDFFYRPDLLFITECGDVRNKTYRELVTTIIKTRMMSGNPTVLVLTMMTPEVLLIPEFIPQFDVLDLRGMRFKRIAKPVGTTGSPVAVKRDDENLTQKIAPIIRKGGDPAVVEKASSRVEKKRRESGTDFLMDNRR